MITLPPLPNIIKRYRINAKKSLGQHFLLDSNITDQIVKCAGPGDLVIEIGPGPGGLTRSILMQSKANIIAIEQDKRCIEALNELAKSFPDRLKIIEGDALKIDEKELLGTGGKAKIIANLPYNISTVLLFKWLDNLEYIESMTLMFQKEVADRIISTPNKKSYGRISVMCQWLCNIKHEFDLSPKLFTPPPKIYSSVITLTPRATPLAPANKKTLEKLCAALFQQRRKMLRGSLKQLTKNPEVLLDKAGIESTLRPEQLSVEDFCRLASVYESYC